MSRLIFIIVVIIIFAIFFIQNMVKVPVKFVVTDSVDIRLTYLLITGFIVGYITCIVQNAAKAAKNLSKKKMMAEYEEMDDELEDDFDH